MARVNKLSFCEQNPASPDLAENNDVAAVLSFVHRFGKIDKNQL